MTRGRQVAYIIKYNVAILGFVLEWTYYSHKIRVKKNHSNNSIDETNMILDVKKQVHN